MPLTILLPMVIIGMCQGSRCFCIFWACRDLPGSTARRRRGLPGCANSRKIRRRASPCARTTVRRLIEARQGFGIVWPMGADTTARYLAGASVIQNDIGLRIDLPDYTAPRIQHHTRQGLEEAATFGPTC